ncbi:MAG: acetyl-CoA carboxylase biotin carboxylase subunit [Candidatus Bathyarchaeota archaeon]|jgi:acetyl-CoA carboxylase biotin carboxylase subunit|nr:acetyl-CoA carboxylase biotin carboxylase subunit [Candidatus Bathyarchaeota archaeon A05DMB-5]MDH7558177.1 acetyl-CoA carboxylase biotin carboxylase subunit [Candidatus Bathyarchaeota archaeon]
MFKKILIANRGEIAVRVIRACRELGAKAVAVYSEADADSLHVQYADESYCVGPADPSLSYLKINKIIEVAKKSKCEAIHPGYGFLSQIPAFAKACEEKDIEFIGPSSEVLKKMGSKVEARRTAVKAGVSAIPGSIEPARSADEAVEIAGHVGFPVLVKAVYGGGGKGMRLVTNKREMRQALELTASEAESSFGKREIYVEKFLPRARHIEFQILADKHGKTIHLGERECSLQRRYQKLIEETPSMLMTEKLRKEMGAAAVKIARAVGYVNAGTVEFLVDQEGHYYFLEMNTRLQVEHLITEMATGLDIVKSQIKIAASQKLEYKQSDIALRGHAINCRINAEDPYNNFMPSPGIVSKLQLPGGPGVRVDTHLYVGYPISVFYDPLIAKLAVWGENRREAIQRMKNALNEFLIVGVKTTVPFHKKIMEDEQFLKGDIHINFVDEKIEKLMPKQALEEEEAAAIIAVLADYVERSETRAVIPKREPKAASLWRLAGRTRRLSKAL